MSAPTPRPKRLSTRLLYPFRFDWAPPASSPGGPSAATPLATLTDALCSHTITIDGKPLPAWACCRLPDEHGAHGEGDDSGPRVRELYLQEFLPPLLEFLFAGHGAHGGRCLQMPERTRAALFAGRLSLWPAGRRAWLDSQQARNQRRSDTRAPLFIDRINELELFVNGLGIGVVSISLELDGGNAAALELATIRTLLYHLSQRRPHRGATVSRYHEADQPQRWQRIPEAQRAQVAAPPADDSDWRARLGRKGGDYALETLLRALIDPIRSAGATNVADDYQPQFSHHSVVQFDASVRFHGDRPHPRLSGQLAALTQLEETGHAGSAADEIPLAWRCLNQRHMAAAASQGSVHFIADQADDEEGAGFNPARPGVVHNKYFIGFLLAFLQDQYLKKAAAHCARLVAAGVAPTDPADAERFAALRHQVLAFDALCRLTHISTRDAHLRYYRLVQDGLSVREAMDGLYSQLADLDALCKFHRQSDQSAELVAINRELNESGRRQEAHQRALVSMQSKIEWVELFLVGVYSVYLTNYLGKNFGFDHTYVGWSILAIAVIASATAAWLLKPWTHEMTPSDTGPVDPDSSHTGKQRQGTCFRLVIVALIALVIGVYLGLGFAWFRDTEHTHNGDAQAVPRSRPVDAEPAARSHLSLDASTGRWPLVLRTARSHAIGSCLKPSPTGGTKPASGLRACSSGYAALAGSGGNNTGIPAG